MLYHQNSDSRLGIHSPSVFGKYLFVGTCIFNILIDRGLLGRLRCDRFLSSATSLPSPKMSVPDGAPEAPIEASEAPEHVSIRNIRLHPRQTPKSTGNALYIARSGTCGVCSQNISKYNCPRCNAVTCSVECFKVSICSLMNTHNQVSRHYLH